MVMIKWKRELIKGLNSIESVIPVEGMIMYLCIFTYILIIVTIIYIYI